VAEAEDVITDVARHATIFARDLWQRRRKRIGGTSTEVCLRDVAPRLDLLLMGVFGQSFPLRTAEPPAPRTFLASAFGFRSGPHALAAVPATDGASIWLPRSAAPMSGLDALTLYKLMALQQAMRARRGVAARAVTVTSEVERSILEVLEADASDRELVSELPGLRPRLLAFRTATLKQRPDISGFPPLRRRLEVMVRTVMAEDLEAQVSEPARLLSRAQLLAAELEGAANGASARLYADLWTGLLYRASAEDRAASKASAADPAQVSRPHAVRLARTPKARQGEEGEDDAKPGAWMVQTAAPHEQVEDPFGMQRPADKAGAEEAEGLADAMSELAQARLVSTPGRPKEVFLSDEAPASRSRLDPPPAPPGDSEVLRFAEWDYRAQAYREGYASVHMSLAVEGPHGWVDRALTEHGATANLVRRRFEMLRAQRVRQPRQREGDDIDLNAFVEGYAAFRAGHPLPPELYETRRLAKRDLAVYLLVDVSGSTDAWISENKRIVDVEREALLLVSMALQHLGEAYGVGAFSGEGPRGVVVRHIKRFDEPYSAAVARRIAGLEPEHYTRAGAALRCASSIVLKQPARQRLLVLLSDGKPNDVDVYEGRYGVEDMRQAVIEAKLQGVNVFCLTVDRQASSYLPSVFGAHQYALLPRPQQLPVVLVEWMQRLLRA
jgi:nitric oxide reductase NorD protein